MRGKSNDYIVTGSKNFHVPIKINTIIDKNLWEKFSQTKNSYGEIVNKIINDIYVNQFRYLSELIVNQCIAGYTSVGDYVGQHFTSK